MENIKLITEFVENSNALDRIYKDEKFYKDHLDTALMIEELSTKKMRIAHPMNVYASLFKEESKYRNIKLLHSDIEKEFIEDKFDFIQENINKFNEVFYNDMEKVSLAYAQKALDEKTLEHITWHYHDWFDYIHPFHNRSGLVARLFLNNMRRVFGLEWIVIKGPEFGAKLNQEAIEYHDRAKRWYKENENFIIKTVP